VAPSEQTNKLPGNDWINGTLSELYLSLFLLLITDLREGKTKRKSYIKRKKKLTWIHIKQQNTTTQMTPLSSVFLSTKTAREAPPRCFIFLTAKTDCSLSFLHYHETHNTTRKRRQTPNLPSKPYKYSCTYPHHEGMRKKKRGGGG